MEIYQVTEIPALSKDPTLHSIVNDLIYEAAPLAVHNRNYIVNNVPADLMMEANGTIISSVLSKLFHTAIRHAQKQRYTYFCEGVWNNGPCAGQKQRQYQSFLTGRSRSCLFESPEDRWYY
ncbi:MAG: hypothetical protein WDO71_16435 [Bacteroidota bacterium]